MRGHHLIGALLPDEVSCDAQGVLVDCYELVRLQDVQRSLCDLPAVSCKFAQPSLFSTHHSASAGLLKVHLSDLCQC